MQITIDEVTIAEIDEALSHFRNKLQDRYGNRLSYHQRELYLEIVNDLLDARLSLSKNA
jgi:hypothetical protein